MKTITSTWTKEDSHRILNTTCELSQVNKQWDRNTRTWTNPENTVLSEKKPVRKAPILWFHLWEMPRTSSFTEIENWLVIAQGWGVRGRGERQGEWLLWVHSSQSDEMFWNRLWQRLPNFMSVLKTTELYNLNRWIVCHVNYISIKLLHNKQISKKQWKCFIAPGYF